MISTYRGSDTFGASILLKPYYSAYEQLAHEYKIKYIRNIIAVTVAGVFYFLISQQELLTVYEVSNIYAAVAVKISDKRLRWSCGG